MARSGSQTKSDLTPGPTSRVSRRSIIVGLVAVVAIAAVVAIEASTQDFQEGGLSQHQPVTVSGSALTPYVSDQADAAVGTVAPVVAGSGWEGDDVTITPNGDPSLVMLMTHWCPHCQVDVPIVQDIIDSGRVPDGLNLYGVNTGTDETRANYPPTKWLIAEGWTPPTLLDDEANTAASALGLTAYPYWIVLDGEGRVVTRRSGELTEEAILELMNVAVGIASPDAVDEGESSSADG